MEADRIVRTARVGSGIAQRRLAALSGVPQPSISGIESGEHDATVGLVGRLLAPLGYQLIAVPSNTPTVAESAENIAQFLSEERGGSAYRQLIQLNDDLAGEPAWIRVVLSAVPPRLVGDQRYDAYIAATVEHHLREVHAPLPDWVREPERVASPAWYPAGVAGLEESAARSTPVGFRQHGLIVDKADLVSV